MAKRKNAVVIALQALADDPKIGAAIGQAVLNKSSTIEDVLTDIRFIIAPRLQIAVETMRDNANIGEPDKRDLWEMFEDWWYKANFAATDEQILALEKVKKAWLKGKVNGESKAVRRKNDVLTRSIIDKHPMPVAPKTPVNKKVGKAERDLVKKLIDSMYESFDGGFDYIDDVLQACYLVGFVRERAFADAALTAMKLNRDGNFGDILYDVTEWYNENTKSKAKKNSRR